MKEVIHMNKTIIKEILSWVLVLIIAIVLAKLANRFVLFKVSVPTGSMEDTIMIGDKIYTQKVSYWFKDPERGDIVVFPFPDDEEKDYIKRIIGLPGETIAGIDGLVYIDGEPIDEPYVKEKLKKDFGPYTVPENHYFMMGDNRNDSNDSRYWDNTFLNRDKIMGKALLKYPNFTWMN
ncbi:MAG TPA: signal peptidase I [Clostridiales bacterium]|nr:signal peptidase I [Clostridiales bacterium]